MPELFVLTSAHLLVAGGVVLLATLLGASIYLKTIQHLQERYRGTEPRRGRSFSTRLFRKNEDLTAEEEYPSQGMIISEPKPSSRHAFEAGRGIAGFGSTTHAGTSAHSEVDESYEVDSVQDEWSDDPVPAVEENGEFAEEPNTVSYDVENENELAGEEDVYEPTEEDPVLRRTMYEEPDDETYFVESFSINDDSDRWKRPEDEIEVKGSEQTEPDAFETEGDSNYSQPRVEVEVADENEAEFRSESTRTDSGSDHDEPSIASITGTDQQSESEEVEASKSVHTVSLLVLFEKEGTHYRSNPQPFIQFLRETGFVQIQDEFVLRHRTVEEGEMVIHARNFEAGSLAELARHPDNTVGFRLYFYSARVTDAVATMNLLSEIGYLIEKQFEDPEYSFMPLKRYYDVPDSNPKRLTQQALQRMEDDLRERYAGAGQAQKRVDLRVGAEVQEQPISAANN